MAMQEERMTRGRMLEKSTMQPQEWAFTVNAYSLSVTRSSDPRHLDGSFKVLVQHEAKENLRDSYGI